MIVNDKLYNDYTAIFVTLHNWTSFLLPNWYLRIITYKYKYKSKGFRAVRVPWSEPDHHASHKLFEI